MNSISFIFFLLQISHSAGSSSNVSSSNSNNSDHGFNSLDSMENEIPANNAAHHKKRIPKLINSNESMSYLGPFNFRQLLKPVQNRLAPPQRNARNIKVSK